MPDASSNMFRGGGYGGGQSSINANPSSSGGDQGGFLSWLQGLAPEAQAAIMRVMAQANPVSSADAAPLNNVGKQLAPGQPGIAASLTSNGNPLSNPSPVDPRLAAGGPPVPAGAVPPMGTPPIGGGPGMAMQSPTGIIPGGGSSGGGGASGPIVMGPEGSAAPPISVPIGGGPGNTMEAPTGTPAVHPAVARAAARARIDPRATALAPGAAAPLGYYSAPTGNARGAVYSPYTDPKDPRIFRGPLAAS